MVNKRNNENANPRLDKIFPAAKRLRFSAPRRAFADKTNSPKEDRPTEGKKLTGLRLCDEIHMFNDVSLEVSYRMLHFVDLKGLSNLALVDNKCRRLVNEYVVSNYFVVRLQTILKNESVIHVEECLTHLANIFKRSTMVLRPVERIACIQTFFSKVNDFNFNTEECGRRWGLFWHRIMRGWEFVECSKAYGSLITVGKDSIQRMLTNFFNNTPGKWPEIERRLRIFFRWFVLDYCFKKNEDVGFWVATVLESLTTYHQAKLLYLIFGPLARDGQNVDWTIMSSASASTELIEKFFKKVVECFRYLRSASQDKWTIDSVIFLTEELTSFPSGWLLDNFAQFLLCCDENVIVGILVARSRNGRVDEVSYLFHSMCLNVTRCCNKTMSFMVRVFFLVLAEIPTESVRLELIKTFAREASTRLCELYGITPANANVRDEISAHEKFFGLIMLMALRNNVNFNPEP